jgi:O-6-methylguanine DNA methyltransferase
MQTYGDLAYRLNQPKAARAVGGACGANPIPVIVPCHRIVGANGSLTGFSGGMKCKVRLLRIEGIELPLH